MTVLETAGWLAGWAVAGRSHHLPMRSGAHAGLNISVVVPTRNEAGRLPALLDALRANGFPGPGRQVVLADDKSDDGSPELAQAAGATVVFAPPPPGWRGKPWACLRGAETASGDVVVFMDADARPARGFIERLAAEAARTGGLVSVQPQHHVKDAHEQLSAIASAVALMAGTGRPGSQPHWKGPAGFGPAMAVSRSAYLRAGGHRCARRNLLDDLALAQGMHRAGLPVSAFAAVPGTGELTCRPYPEGLRSMVDGWSRNLCEGASMLPLLRTAAVCLWVAGALRSVRAKGPRRLAFYALYALQARALVRRAGNFHWSMYVFFPLPLLVFVALSARSAFFKLTGRALSWRGRPVPARPPLPVRGLEPRPGPPAVAALTGAEP